jgi:hypothetical protein
LPVILAMMIVPPGTGVKTVRRFKERAGNNRPAKQAQPPTLPLREGRNLQA